MRASPAISVTGYDLGTHAGSKLAYVAALFKGTLVTWPGVALKLTGDSLVAGMAQDRLERTQTPGMKIGVDSRWREQSF